MEEGEGEGENIAYLLDHLGRYDQSTLVDNALDLPSRLAAAWAAEMLRGSGEAVGRIDALFERVQAEAPARELVIAAQERLASLREGEVVGGHAVALMESGRLLLMLERVYSRLREKARVALLGDLNVELQSWLDILGVQDLLTSTTTTTTGDPRVSDFCKTVVLQSIVFLQKECSTTALDALLATVVSAVWDRMPADEPAWQGHAARTLVQTRPHWHVPWRENQGEGGRDEDEDDGRWKYLKRLAGRVDWTRLVERPHTGRQASTLGFLLALERTELEVAKEWEFLAQGLGAAIQDYQGAFLGMTMVPIDIILARLYVLLDEPLHAVHRVTLFKSCLLGATLVDSASLRFALFRFAADLLAQTDLQRERWTVLHDILGPDASDAYRAGAVALVRESCDALFAGRDGAKRALATRSPLLECLQALLTDPMPHHMPTATLATLNLLHYLVHRDANNVLGLGSGGLGGASGDLADLVHAWLKRVAERVQEGGEVGRGDRADEDDLATCFEPDAPLAPLERAETTSDPSFARLVAFHVEQVRDVLYH